MNLPLEFVWVRLFYLFMKLTSNSEQWLLNNRLMFNWAFDPVFGVGRCLTSAAAPVTWYIVRQKEFYTVYSSFILSVAVQMVNPAPTGPGYALPLQTV